MGRDYWTWGRSFRKSSSAAASPAKYKQSAVAAPAGCLSGALQVFDLHRLLFTAARSGGGSQSPDREYGDSSSAAVELLKGVEAPRNSLELDPGGVAATAAGHTTSTAAMLAGSRYIAIADDDFEIPFAVQVVPRSDSGDQAASSLPRLPLTEDPRSSHSQSRGSTSGRSGNLVARLMGLDMLPEQVISPRTCYANRDVLLSPPPARVRSRLYRLRRVSTKQQEHQHYQQAASVTPRIPLQPRSCNANAADDMRHGTRSLPDTPRMSASSARPSWDSETPRHSLQSHVGGGATNSGWNKENMSASAMRELKSICEDYSALEPSPPRPLKVSVKAVARDKENHPPKETKAGSGVAAIVMSPRKYAREIVRQAKDSVARRISGSSAGGASGSDRDEAGAPGLRSERRIRASSPSSSLSDKSGREAMASATNFSASPRCSPRAALSLESPRSSKPQVPDGAQPKLEDAKQQPIAPPNQHRQPHIQEPCKPSKGAPPSGQPGKSVSTGSTATTLSPSSSSSTAIWKASSCDRFTERLKKPVIPAAAPSRREARITPPSPLSPSSTTPLPQQQPMRNCITRPLSKIHMAPSTALSTHHNLTTGHAPGSTATTSFTTPSPPYNQLKPSRSPPPPALDDPESDQEEEEFRYVKWVLEKAGIRPNGEPVPPSLRWHSPSHPLDPAIFHHLELSSCSITPRGPLRQRCNRKLLFHLVDELLSDILWPQLELQETPLLPGRPSGAAAAVTGDELLGRVWSQARSYPGAECQVIQDIDALVGTDLTDANVRGILQHPAVAEEARSVMAELEVVIMDSLLADAVAAAAEGGSAGWVRREVLCGPRSFGPNGGRGGP